MARDDASGRGSSASDSGRNGQQPWDFELPDLGESTNPTGRRPRGGAGSRAQDSYRAPGPNDSSYDAADQAYDYDSDHYSDSDHDADYDRDSESSYAASHAGPGRDTPGARVHGPEVYRRRRIIALIVAILVVGGVGLGLLNLLNAGDAVEPDPAATAQPTETDPFAGFTARPESESSDGATGPAAMACGDDLEISASTTEETYGGDSEPVLVMTLRNGGDQPCMVNAGTARMNYQVTSGPDTVFDSAHCQIDGQDRPVELQPEQEESARLQWDRHRSVADCATQGDQVNPGTYRLTVALGETRSEGVEFTLE